MMYGHVDHPRHWLGHFRVLAGIQDRTGGFTEFVALPFVHHNAPIYLAGIARPGPTWRENRAVHAMARVLLHGRIDNIQCSWVKLGDDGTRGHAQRRRQRPRRHPDGGDDLPDGRLGARLRPDRRGAARRWPPRPVARPASAPPPTPRSSGSPVPDEGPTAFVLGGGGLLGATEVGMLAALDEAGIRPDFVLGTSIGAINGVFVAADPANAASRLETVWRSDIVRTAFHGSIIGRLDTLARSGTHLHDNTPLRRLIEAHLPARDFAELAVPFQCVAANVERAAAHWFHSGPLVPAVLASAAVPGLLPPVRIDGEHYFDGGLVHSIPVGRAVRLGARRVFVLHVGRIEQPLRPPRRPWEVGLVAFEIARRHRFVEEMSSLPDDVTVHVLPAGSNGRSDGRRADLSQLRYRDHSRVVAYLDQARTATATYLAAHVRP